MKTLKLIGLLAALLLARTAVGQDSLNISRVAMRAVFHHEFIACGANVSDTFYAVYPGEISVYDLRDPSFPKEIGYCLLSITHPKQMVVYQSLGIVMGRDEIGFIDFGNLWNPRLVASVHSPNGVAMIQNSGFLYIAHSDSTLETYDIQNPASPERVSQVRYSRAFSSLDVYGSCLLAAGAQTALFSLANPREPLLVDSLSINSRCVVTYRDRAYFSAGDSGIYVFRFEEDRLSLVSRVVAWKTEQLTIWGQSLVCTNPYMFGEMYEERITHYSLDDLDHPRYLADFPSHEAGWAQGVYASTGRSAVIAYLGMIILDSENLGLHDQRYTKAFKWTDDVYVGRGAFPIVKVGDNIIVNKRETGYYPSDSSINFVYNFSEPANPEIRSMSYVAKICLLLGGTDSQIFTWERDSHDENSYFNIYSVHDGVIEDKLSSLLVRWYREPNYCCYSDSMLFYYTYSGTRGIAAINIADPNNTRIASFLEGQFGALALQNERRLLFSLIPSDGVVILNIADPAHIEEVGRLYQGHRFVSLAIKDNLLFLGDSSVTVLDISDLQNIQEVSQSRLGLLGLVGKLTPIQDHLLLYDYRTIRSCAMMIWEISDLQSPRLVGNYPARYSNLLYSDPNYCILDHGSYFATFNISRALGVSEPLPLAPYTLQLNTPFPNPFNFSTTITFGLSKLAPTRVGVYAVDGRLVEELWTGRDAYPPGEYRVQWDASGVAAGNYFIKLQGGGEELSRRITLVK